LPLSEFANKYEVPVCAFCVVDGVTQVVTPDPLVCNCCPDVPAVGGKVIVQLDVAAPVIVVVKAFELT